MLKFLTIIIVSLLLSQTTQAQKSDTLRYFLNYSNEVVSRILADRLLVIMPPDTISGVVSYHCYEYDLKTKKMTFNGASRTTKADSLVYEGRCISYNYLTGNKSSYSNYSNGEQIGKVVSYYPNGNLYTIVESEDYGPSKFIDCSDSTGHVLASEGNGKWVKVSGNFEIEEGMVKDSLAYGEWQEFEWGKSKYINTYDKGIVVATTDPNFLIGEPVYDQVARSPSFNGKYAEFFIRNVRYPAVDKENNVQGKVLTSFIVEKDGSISDIRIISAPDRTIADETVRVIKLFPRYKPGIINSKAVRTRFLLPTTYTLTSGD